MAYATFGQVEIATAIGSEASKLLGGLLGGGGVDPARKQIIDSYYTAAVNGDATGVANLQKWLATVPPHPAASNQYAQQKLNSLIAMGKTVGGTGSVIGVGTLNRPSSLASIGLGGSIGGIPVSLLAIGAGVYLLTRKR